MPSFKKIKKRIFILSISSDIGYELAIYWIAKGYKVIGTYKSFSDKCKILKNKGATLYKLDLKKYLNIVNFFKKQKIKWDWLIVATGTQNPIGKFLNVNDKEWATSIEINFTHQFIFLKKMFPYRNKKNSRVLFFAGGGTNNATINYSAYTISKIASIKMCELLAAEIKNVIFTILGPGWVKTKIHKSTLQNKKASEENYNKTIKMLNSNKCFPIKKVVKACDWILNQKKNLVNGRNFSAVHDPWENKKIYKILNDKNNFKLRRYGNELFKN